ncbi:MAG TPA: hypothetical protein VGJ97_07190 [Anaerolineaceae bacterium]
MTQPDQPQPPLKTRAWFSRLLTEPHFRSWTFPLAALLLFAVCFGPFLTRFSLFWDDWVQLLSRHLYGYAAYFRYFYERPLSGWTLVVFGPWMGDSRLGWEIFTLGLRWGCVLAAWGLFQSIWPRYRRDAALAALFFAVYPAFTQQPISVAYSQHWLQYLLFLLSLVCMVMGVGARPRRWAWIAAALVCQALQFSITEFFVGAEFIRPLLLWIVLGEGDGERQPLGKQTLAALRAWAPYLLVFVGYMIWRVFILGPTLGGRNSPTLLIGFKDQPLSTLLTLANYALNDLRYILVSVWRKVAENVAGGLTKPIVLLGWGVGIGVAGLLGVYLTRLHSAQPEPENTRRRVALGWIAAGLFGVLIGPAPLWSNSQDIFISIQGDAPHADRFALASMVWAGLLLAGLLLLLVKSWRARALLTAALVGLLACFQFRLANVYRVQSEDQTNFYWELGWRAPAITPGTAIIAENILFPNQGLFATSGAINLLYPQPQNPDSAAYWVYSLQPNLKKSDPAKGPVKVHTDHRIFTFSAQTPDSLLLAYDTYGADCMWVLHPGDEDYPNLTDAARKWLAGSNLARIGQEPTAGYPSELLFGREPEHGWCYYFEKADLARQFANWPTAAALGDQALAKGYRPGLAGSDSVYEWMPFLEAYARVGRWSEITGLVQQILAHDANYGPFLCGRWEAWSAGQLANPTAAQADQAIRQAACRAP